MEAVSGEARSSTTDSMVARRRGNPTGGSRGTDLRSLWVLLSPWARARVPILSALTLVGALLEVIGIGAIPVFVATITDPTLVTRYLPDSLGASSSWDSRSGLAFGGLALAGFFITKNAYLGFVSWYQGTFAAHERTAVGLRMFRLYLRSPYVDHLDRNSADLVRNINIDTERAVYEVIVPTIRLGIELVVAVLTIALLVLVEPLVSLLAVGIFVSGSVVFYRVVRTRSNRHGPAEERHRAQMFRTVTESLGGWKEINVRGREDFFTERFRAATQDYANVIRFKTVAMVELPRLFLESVAVLSMSAAIVAMLAQGRDSEGILPALALLAVAALRLGPSFNRIVGSISSIRYAQIALEHIFADLDANSGGPARAGRSESRAADAGNADLGDGEIAVRKVTFRYPGAPRPALSDLSLDVGSGEMVGIVGASGAGKSTVLDVMLGLLLPDTGQVRSGGVDIHQDVRQWRERVGYVPQSIFLLDATLRENIALGVEDDAIDDARVAQCIRAAQLEEFVRSLPNDLRTSVGERGVRLSGGQRQRVGIARALYHDPMILLLDEATSALDSETESSVVRALERLRGDRTIVVIAHRLSTVAKCDRIYFLHEGRVAGVGSYDELLAGSAAFRSMVAAAHHLEVSSVFTTAADAREV